MASMGGVNAKIKGDLWKSDWFFGLVVSLLFFIFAYPFRSDLLESLDRKAYDMGVRASSKAPNDKIAIIAIDDESIANIGRWPWSRDVHAKMTDLLVGGKGKGDRQHGVLFRAAGRSWAGLCQQAARHLWQGRSCRAGGRGQRRSYRRGHRSGHGAARRATRARIAADGCGTQGGRGHPQYRPQAAESYTKASNVVLPLVLTLGEPRGKPDRPLPEFALKNSFQDKGGDVDIAAARCNCRSIRWAAPRPAWGTLTTCRISMARSAPNPC